MAAARGAASSRPGRDTPLEVDDLGVSSERRQGVSRIGRRALAASSRRPLAALLSLTLGPLTQTALAQTALVPDAGTPAAALPAPAPPPVAPSGVVAPEARPHEAPAPALPEYLEPALPRASDAELRRVEALITELLAPSEATRLQALEHMRTVDPSWLAALRERAERLDVGSSRAGMEALLAKLRPRAREPRDARHPASPAPSTLERVVRSPDRTSSDLRPLTELLAYARAFEAIATWPAVRSLLELYGRSGELLKEDTEQAMARLGDLAQPALIEASAHPTPRIADFARRQLAERHERAGGEPLDVSSPALRADILLAHGKARDAGAARLLLAFAASEHARVRLAARQALTMLGERSVLALRDVYATATGNAPPDDWSWRRVAEELFARFDAHRQAEVDALFDAGRTAEMRGDLDAARAAFDQVLARAPLFERGAGMLPVYLAFAEQRADADPKAAALAARRAERLAPQGPLRDRAESLRCTLDAAALLARGIVDDASLERARSLDPSNARAATLQATIAARTGADRATFRRYAIAAAILALALAALIVFALRARHERALRA